MTSFLTHRARVHAARLPLHRRHSALRTCLTVFAPYGLRATYHHLTLSAAIPRQLEADPDALARAVEELHEARVLWLIRAEEYTVQRRAEKQAGRRAVPNPRPWWLRSWWESPERAWFEDHGTARPSHARSSSALAVPRPRKPGSRVDRRRPEAHSVAGRSRTVAATGGETGWRSEGRDPRALSRQFDIAIHNNIAAPAEGAVLDLLQRVADRAERAGD
ncbi:hypothetical protein ACWGNF_09945 [Streptomyces sp. NPDC055808]